MTHVFDATGHVATAAERSTLEAFLDHQREEVKAKVRDVSDQEARRQLVPSATTSTMWCPTRRTASCPCAGSTST
jgi:hypothetical protein